MARSALGGNLIAGLGAGLLCLLLLASWCAGGLICSDTMASAWFVPFATLLCAALGAILFRLHVAAGGDSRYAVPPTFDSRSAEEQRAILQTIIDNIPGAVTLFDGQFRLVACNRQLIDLLDFPSEMFVGRMPTLEEMVSYNATRGEYGAGDPDEIFRRFMERVRQNKPHHFERMRPNGMVLDIRGAPLPDGGFVTIYTDITQLKRVQTELEQNVHYLRSILDHLPQGISVFDDQLRLKCWNDAFREVLDLPVEAVYKDVPFDDLIMIPALRGEYGPGNPVQQVKERRTLAMRFAPHRFERTRPTGRTHLVEGRPLKSGERVMGFITSYTDITDHKESELALVRQNAMLQALVDNMPGGVSVFGADLRLSLFNAEAARLLGFPRDFLERHPSFADVIRFNAERGEYGSISIEAKVAEMVAMARDPVQHRFERVRPDGTVVEVRGAPLPGGGFVSIYIDITHRKEVENELRRRNGVFQTLVNNIPGGVTLFDKDLHLVAHNQEYRRLLDFPDELFDGVPTLERFFRFNVQRGEYGPGDGETMVQSMLERARLNQPHLFERTRPNGTVLEIRGLPLPDGGFVTIYTDITERKTAAAAIERLAHRDALTGLANRYNLEARLDQVLADAQRHASKVAIIFIDMDRFKSINDTLGHSVGDSFLVEVATRLTANTRDTDIVARLGGDEFVIVLSELADAGLVDSLADKIVKVLAEPMAIGREKLTSSASLGFAIFPDDADDRETLMRNADIAMYHAKGAGRGRYQHFDAQMSAVALARTRIEAELRQTIERGGFMLYYQPQINAASGHITGLEALIRWRHDDGAFVAPDIFIPVAEDAGLIEMIGSWVLREACLTLRDWDNAGLCVQRVSVNLSARQLKSRTLVGMVRSILLETGLRPERLELEVTETAAMEDPQLTIENLRALRALGVGLAIDDFGTGYSSLGYLKLLPIDRLKIDRTFVMDIETDSNDAAICSATIGLAHSLGLQVVAEGVETAAQQAFLRRLGCDELQGYYFHRPLPQTEIRKLFVALPENVEPAPVLSS